MEFDLGWRRFSSPREDQSRRSERGICAYCMTLAAGKRQTSDVFEWVLIHGPEEGLSMCLRVHVRRRRCVKPSSWQELKPY